MDELSVQGPGGKLVETSGGTRWFFATNHLGTIAARMNVSGTLTETYRYLPYGERYAGTLPPPTTQPRSQSPSEASGPQLSPVGEGRNAGSLRCHIGAPVGVPRFARALKGGMQAHRVMGTPVAALRTLRGVDPSTAPHSSPDRPTSTPPHRPRVGVCP